MCCKFKLGSLIQTYPSWRCNQSFAVVWLWNQLLLCSWFKLYLRVHPTDEILTIWRIVPLDCLVHAGSILWMVFSALFSVTSHSLGNCAFGLLMMHYNIWIDVGSRDDIRRYLLHLLELLMMSMRHDLLASVSPTINNLLSVLIELMLLDRLLAVDVAIVNWGLRVVIGITFCVEVVIKRFFRRISRLKFPKFSLINLLDIFTLHRILVLNIEWLLRVVWISKVLYQFVVFLDLFLVILGWL